jgi:hypothetical protein
LEDEDMRGHSGSDLWKLAAATGLAFALCAGAIAETADVCTAGIAPNRFSIMTSFNALYPASPLVGDCTVCHEGIPSPRNPYGMAFDNVAGADNTAKLQAIEGMDSDGDGTSNIDEINAGTNPGVAGPPPSGPTYVGSSNCSGCHTQTYASWNSTLHSSIYRSGSDLVADNILPTWSGVISVEDQSRGLGPLYVELGDSGDPINGPFTATLYSDALLTSMIAGPLEVTRLHGGREIAENANNDPRNTAFSSRGLRSNGEHYPGEGPVLGKQRYQVTLGAQYYILPIQWNPLSDIDDERKGWVEYHLRDWIDDSSNLVLEASDSEERRCAGCHTTGIVDVTYDNAAITTIPGTSYDIIGAYELVGNPDVEDNIACEACHGPASDHVGGGFMGTPGDRMIIQPALNLTKEQRVDACGACHSRGNSVGMVNGITLGYPYRDAEPRRPIPGDVWSDFFAEAGGYWIDEPDLRVASQHHQQYEEFVTSHHYNNPFVEITCSTCHDNHGTANEHDLVTSIENSVSGEVAVTGARGVGEGNLCIGCHYSHGPFEEIELVDLKRHYWHPPEGTHGSPDCTNCHMPAMAISGVAYDIHSHAFHVITPDETIDNQIANSCMVMCHNGPFSTGYVAGAGPRQESFKDWTEAVDVEISEWLEEVRPSSRQVARYLTHNPEELVELVHEADFMAPAMDANGDTQTLTGTDASPFVINAADIVTFVNEGR